MIKGLVFVMWFQRFVFKALAARFLGLITSSPGGVDALRQRAVFVASCKLDNDASYVSAELKSLCEPLNGFCTRQWCYPPQPRGFNNDAKERPFYCLNGMLPHAGKVAPETLRNKNPSPGFP
jgi:hypothetical protein